LPAKSLNRARAREYFVAVDGRFIRSVVNNPEPFFQVPYPPGVYEVLVVEAGHERVAVGVAEVQ